MATSLLFNLALVLAVSIVLGELPPTLFSLDGCGLECRFRFCRSNADFDLAPVGRRLIMRDPGSAVNPFICLANGTAGRIFKVGQAFIRHREELRYTRISKFNPETLLDDGLLPRNLFGVGIIPSLRKDGRQKSGLTRMPITAHQYDVIGHRCIVLPIRAYEEIDPATGATIRRRTRKLYDCVSFQTIAPKMAIELFWESSDDFDLMITEPDGDNLSRRNRRTEFGRFIHDNGAGHCIPPNRVHHEDAIYETPSLETGEYSINVRHYNNCGDGPTKYTVRVLIDGIKLFEQSGRSNSMRRDDVVSAIKFRI